jgi:hypothetical protein
MFICYFIFYLLPIIKVDPGAFLKDNYNTLIIIFINNINNLFKIKLILCLLVYICNHIYIY